MIHRLKRTWIKRGVRSLPPLQAVGRVNDLALRVQRDPGALPLPLQGRVRLLRQFAQAHVFRVLLEYIRAAGVAGVEQEAESCLLSLLFLTSAMVT